MGEHGAIVALVARLQSGLMPARATTFFQRFCSAPMKALNCAGVSPMPITASSLKRPEVFGDFTALPAAAASFATCSSLKDAGAIRPYHCVISKPDSLV